MDEGITKNDELQETKEMRNKTLVITLAAVCMLAVSLSGCSSNSEATPSAVPTETLAPTIVVTPAPTQEATAEPEESASESSEASASSSSGTGTSSTGVLKREMQGEAVTEAQERLQALGYLDKVTGYFGTDTERAVTEFQQKNNLDADGKIGPKTLEVLMSDDAVQA